MKDVELDSRLFVPFDCGVLSEHTRMLENA